MEILKDHLLAPYTTLKIGGPAKNFCIVKKKPDLQQALGFINKNNRDIFVLGGGSNLVVSDKGYDGFVLKIENQGYQIIKDDGKFITLKVAAGENWDNLVEYAVMNNLSGMENLSHIPGSVGAVAVQNVGAYGQEASQIISKILAIKLKDQTETSFNAKECEFGYRSSIFNSTHKGEYLIWEIEFKLEKNGPVNLTYKDLKTKFEGSNPTLADVRRAVTEIRDTKFPFPTEAKNGNVGSFFKNPILNENEYSKVKEKVNLTFGAGAAAKLEDKIFKNNDGVKIPAAFLIDICGLKGLSVGGAATNPKQPLVILNSTGKASALDIFNLAKTIQSKVYELTNVLLKSEPEFLGLDPEGLK